MTVRGPLLNCLLWYNQLQQNHRNNAKVGRELPKQFAESLSVGKLSVGKLGVCDFVSQILQTLCKPEII